jgi:hypothetical protein
MELIWDNKKTVSENELEVEQALSKILQVQRDFLVKVSFQCFKTIGSNSNPKIENFNNYSSGGIGTSSIPNNSENRIVHRVQDVNYIYKGAEQFRIKAK